MSGAAPLTLEEAGSCFAPLEKARKIVLAVSGGPDSVALMGFAAALARQGALPPLAVATVDHGLQPGSDRVAAQVAERAAALGLPAHVLRWEGPKPPAGIQAAARQARYELLVDLAARIDASHLATAHTLDDQAETILFRMARGSGVAGLAGMQAAVPRGSVTHVRPFLGIPKLRLVEACRMNGWAFVEDAANRNLRFARARMRKLLPALSAEGLDASALARLGQRCARTAAAISDKAMAALEDARLPPAGERQRFASARLMAEPTAILVRALEIGLTDFAHAGPPRLGRLEALVDDLQDAFREPRAFRRTLHGAVVSWGAGSDLVLTRETRRRRAAPGSRKA